MGEKQRNKTEGIGEGRKNKDWRKEKSAKGKGGTEERRANEGGWEQNSINDIVLEKVLNSKIVYAIFHW